MIQLNVCLINGDLTLFTLRMNDGHCKCACYLINQIDGGAIIHCKMNENVRIGRRGEGQKI